MNDELLLLVRVLEHDLGAVDVGLDADIKGTDNNSAFIGADFAGGGISGDSATPQVDGTGITIKAGGNIKVAATTFLKTSISADTDGGGAFDASHANSTTDLHDNTATAVGKNAHVTGSTVALIAKSGGSHTGTADAFAVAFIGGAFATAELKLDTNATSIADGDSSSTGVITGINGVDIRALHDNLHYDFDGTGICICIGPSSGSDPTNASLDDTASGHQGMTVVAGAADHPRSHDERPALGDAARHLHGRHAPRALRPGRAARTPTSTTRNRKIHWNSDVVIYAGPSPLLIIGPDGKVLTAVNIAANGVSNPAPGNAPQRRRRTSRSTT